MRVDGAAPRGLWPPAGGRLCRRVVKEKVLRIDRPASGGFLSLTGPLAPRVVVAASPQIIKRGRGWPFGHACGVRVDGAAPRGLWPPAGGGLCRRVVKEKDQRVQRIQRVWIAAGGGNEYL